MSGEKQKTLYLALPEGQNYGWGLCGAHLRRELTRLAKIQDVLPENSEVPGPVFGALEGVSLKPWMPVRGTRNLSYVFFENALQADSFVNAQRSDLIFGGSTWCCERMNEAGIRHCEVLIQGIDPEIFFPREPDLAPSDKFVLFSGGKFELRKGQDLVLKAFALLQDKYPDLQLLTAWQNQWPHSLQTMELSPNIRFELKGDTWPEQMQYLCAINGIDPARVQVCSLLPQHKLPAVIARTHLGVFPNRCEGGTNLALMEYMACGRPVIATYTSGHRDVLTNQNAILLSDLNPLEINSSDGKPLLRWEEPTVDSVVAAIEHAYRHRDEIASLASRAAADMQKLTWETMARRVLEFV